MTNHEAVKACRKSGIKFTVLCTLTQAASRFSCITPAKVPRPLSQSGRVEKHGNYIIYKQLPKLRLFILQMKCC